MEMKYFSSKNSQLSLSDFVMTELVLLLRWAAANPASASVGGGVLDVNQFPGEEDSKVVGFFFQQKM